MFSKLAVRGFRSVLPLVVVFGNAHRDCGIGRSGWVVFEAEQNGVEGQAGDVLKDIGVLDGFGDGYSPGEGSVAGDQDSGNGDGVEIAVAESLSDDFAGIADVCLGDLPGGEGIGDRNGAVKIVGVGGAEAGDGAACLRPRGGKLRVGVDDAADLREGAVEESMCIEIAGRAQGAFDDFAVDVRNDQIGGGERCVVDTTWLDDD